MSAADSGEAKAANRRTAQGVTRAGPLALVAAGRRAFREVPGLRLLLIKGLLLLYGLFLVTGVLVLGLLYRLVVQPLSGHLAAFETSGNFFLELLAPLLFGLLWLAQLSLLAATLLLSFVVSISLLSLWFEALASRIAAHARGGSVPEASFSLLAWLRSLGQALRDGALLFGLVVLALLLGFVPLVGPFLAFALSCFVMGWEVREPYLAVRAAQGTPLTDLRSGLGWWTLVVGALPVLLALIPWLGWLLLPAVLTLQVAGVAWLSERGAA